jgi:hypothetical protein
LIRCRHRVWARMASFVWKAMTHASNVWNRHGGDCVRLRGSPTTRMILPMRNGCERSMSFVRIVRFSRAAIRLGDARIRFAGFRPIGSGLSSPRIASADQCRNWIDVLIARGIEIVVPEISDYEVRRELTRINASGSLKGNGRTTNSAAGWAREGRISRIRSAPRLVRRAFAPRGLERQ